LLTILVRAGARIGMAALFLLGAADALQTAVAEGDTRTLSFHHLHTGENITITYKRDGRYDQAALKKLDWFMRDWRRKEQTHMDPHLFDLLWETYREVGATQPIQVVCGYRSPATNAMLRARSSGVAQFSQHTQGHAIDFYIPGVPLAKIRQVGLQLQRGGVGFYPTSGSPFVHMDTGTIRHWPRMTYAQLHKVFPDGRTVHVPADGHPLPGYALALADVERHGNVPNTNSLEAARAAGMITDRQERTAEIEAQRPKRTLLARLFNFGKQKDADEAANEQAAPARKRSRLTTSVASLARPKHVPLPTARPKPVAVAAAKPKPAAKPFVTASIASNMFDKRGLWTSPAVNGTELPAWAAAKAHSPLEVAAAGRETTGSIEQDVLAYAAESDPVPAAHARPMGKNLPRLPREATMMPAPGNSSVVAKPPLAAAMAISGQGSDSPWLRAAMLTPSVSAFMTTTRLGHLDPRRLHELLHKPTQSLMMTFSADPALGMVADRFTGNAVVFLATASFSNAKTASLQ
jgi:uncharacterized protein YcbK (DUF882 family)